MDDIVAHGVAEVDRRQFDTVDQDIDRHRLVAHGAQLEIQRLGPRRVESDMLDGNDDIRLRAFAPHAVGVRTRPVVVQHAGALVQPAKTDLRLDRRPHGLGQIDILGGVGRNDPDTVQHAQTRLQAGRSVALLEEDEQVVAIDDAALEGVHPGFLIGDLDDVFPRRIHGVDRLGLRRRAPAQLIEQLVVEMDIGGIEVDPRRLGDQLVPHRRRRLVKHLRTRSLAGRLAHGGRKALQIVGLHHQDQRQHDGDRPRTALEQHHQRRQHHAIGDRPHQPPRRPQHGQRPAQEVRHADLEDIHAVKLRMVRHGDDEQGDEGQG